MIKIQVTNTVLRLDRLLGLKMPKEELERFEYYFAKIYIENIKLCINTQAIKWAPLSFKYLLYKRRKGYSLNIWECKGVLKYRLRYFKKGRYLVIGWTPTLENNGVLVWRYAQFMEYGTYKTPPRPLFRVVTNKLISELPIIYEEYLASHTKSLSSPSNLNPTDAKNDSKGIFKSLFAKKSSSRVKPFYKRIFDKASHMASNSVMAIPKMIKKVFGEVFKK